MPDLVLPTPLPLTTPIHPPVDPEHDAIVRAARRDLRRGSTRSDGCIPPFTPTIHRAERAVVNRLEQYARNQFLDRLYIFEFQGMNRQYVMVGRTSRWERRLSEHRQGAAPHGFGLVDGWLSPGVADAYVLEQITLMIGGHLHGVRHFRERFYGMDFEVGLSIARSVFEIGARYPLKRRPSRSRRTYLTDLFTRELRRSPRQVDLATLFGSVTKADED